MVPEHHFLEGNIGLGSQKNHSQKHSEDRRDTDFAVLGRWVVANQMHPLTAGFGFDMKGLQKISRKCKPLEFISRSVVA